jgi:hypothetical protein
MRPKDRDAARQLSVGLDRFRETVCELPGINESDCRDSLIEQLLESMRRVRFIELLPTRPLNPSRADPSNDLFDPLKAAVIRKAEGNIEEACWLTFLSVHFGKNHRTGWRLVRDVYGRLGQGNAWAWHIVSQDPSLLKRWIGANYHTLIGQDGVARHFGNHRKYETLNPQSRRGTGYVIESYITWIRQAGCHAELIRSALDVAAGDARRAFKQLYEAMHVMSFGRTGKFDYLTMLAKLGLAPLEAASPYLHGATGPLKGARLLFDADSEAEHSVDELEALAIELEGFLPVGRQGLQVLEDALCNWQKSPNRFVPFRG